MDDLKDLAGELRKQASRSLPPKLTKYYKSRQRAFWSLLVFVVAVGLPIVGVPSLRERLRSRVQGLRAAATAPAVASQPSTAVVGENQQPYPAEYFKATAPQPEWARVLASSSQPFQVRQVQPQATSEPPANPAVVQDAQQQAAKQEGQEPEYRQGAAEQQAYELVIQSSQPLAAMVNGSDSKLRFKGWAAAKTEEEAMLVRLTFVYVPDGSEREYIWRVKPSSKQVAPLNFYARSIPKL
jgi:hypothetical protein